LVFPRNPLQPSTQLDPRSFHWTPQLDPWSFHWTLSRWSFNPKNKNDYVLMFLKKRDWEDEEDEVSFRFLTAQTIAATHSFDLCYNCFSLVNSCFFTAVKILLIYERQKLLVDKTELCIDTKYYASIHTVALINFRGLIQACIDTKLVCIDT
jgi:hypothetical protein